jgi:ribosomal protein S18 acetylase RimI-like enzyme
VDPAIVVRRATPADAEGISELISRVSAESPFLGERDLKPPPENFRILTRPEEARIIIVVAVEDGGSPGRIVGYAHAVAGIPSTMRHVATVAVAVDARCRGQGIATRLLNMLVEEGRRRGWTRLRASVWANNPESRRLFERVGFRLDAEIPEQLMGPDGRLVDEVVYGYRL